MLNHDSEKKKVSKLINNEQTFTCTQSTIYFMLQWKPQQIFYFSYVTSNVTLVY